jgi:hypothetical protein
MLFTEDQHAVEELAAQGTEQASAGRFDAVVPSLVLLGTTMTPCLRRFSYRLSG